MKYNKSNIMREAHKFFNNSSVATFAEALHLAWLNAKVRVKMLLGKCEFTFKKKNGEIRHAVGTLCRELGAVTLGTGESAPNVQSFFDTELGAWRCFIKTKIMSIA